MACARKSLYAGCERKRGIRQSKLLDAADNIIYSKNHLTALIGVENLVVVQAEGVTLICPKERAEEIKKLISG